MSALQYVDVPGYSALLLRRTYGELEQPDGLIPQSLAWFATVPEHIRPKYNKSDHEWMFPSGARIVFGHLDNPNAMIRYQGGGYHFVGFDELTHFDEQSYEFIAFSRQRRPPAGPLSQVPMRVRATANPGGPGHIWVKRRFIDERKPDVAFIPAKVWDNPGIDTDDYVKRLSKMDDVLQQQLLQGDWGAFAGAAFTIDPDAHLVEPITPVPAYWERFESLDPGLGATAWLLWAADEDGNLVVLDEHYQEEWIVSEHVQRIKELRAQGWERKDDDGWPVRNTVWADPAIHKMGRGGGQRSLGEPASLLTEYTDCGIGVSLANNDPRAGYAHLRELLKLDPTHRFPAWHPRYGEHEAPRLYIVGSNCPNLVEQVQTAPLQPIEKKDAGEIVAPQWEGRHGHAVAALRYGAMSRARASKQPEPEVADPRSAQMVALMERRRSPKKQTFVEY